MKDLPPAGIDTIFNPRSVAVIGATETSGSVGATLMRNLMSTSFGGIIYPVHPKRPGVFGIKAYKDIASIPGRIDLAVIATQAPTVPEIIRQCVAVGVGGAVIISAGFKELGPIGAALEQQVTTEAKAGKMRIIGPNCLGVMNPVGGLNATFAATIARPGNVAFLSQSGALCTAILDWSLREQVGFSAFVSTGSMVDVGWGDWIDYLGNDPHTRSILIYMESIGDARSFLSAAREVALVKPIIVIKAGRTEAAAHAAASHTGALTGSDEVLDAAFWRCGVLRVDTISDLFYMAEVLARQPRPRGPRLTIITNAGGPAVLAADSLVRNGGQLADLSSQTINGLDQVLPSHWSHGNPIDVLGDAAADRYAEALKIATADDNSDGLLVILTPQAMTEPTRTAEVLSGYAKLQQGGHTKPVLASWMGGPLVTAGEEILNRAGIPTFPYPDTAARAFDYMWRYTYNLRGLYETPAVPGGVENISPQTARRIIEQAGTAGRTLLNEHESKQLLAAYGIPTIRTEPASDAETAVKRAGEIGYPVVLKLLSNTLTHKTDVGGVRLNLGSAAEVRSAFSDIAAAVRASAGGGHFDGVTVQPMIRASDAYEIILGSSIDPQFGPVLLFGAGGQLVEIFKDRALALPPLNATLARRMMEQTKILTALRGVRGRAAVDLGALEQLLVHFSQLVVEHPRIKEIDINPLLVSSQQMVALDARVVLHPVEMSDAQLPRSAIRPYPSQYASAWKLHDGRPVLIRPIRPEDETALVAFHAMLSESSVRYRYFQPLKLESRISHERLSRICFNDYDRELALVAQWRETAATPAQILGVGRLSKLPGGQSAEFAVLIADAVQKQGLGSELLTRLVQIARDEKLSELAGDILPENLGMQKIAQRLGFQLQRDMEENMVRAMLRLQ